MVPGGLALGPRLPLLRRPAPLLLVGAGLLLALLACAGPAGAPGEPEAGAAQGSEFPQPEALYELRDQPLREVSPFATRFRDVDSWQLAGPFPEVAGTAPRSGSQPWDPLLDEWIARRAGLAVASTSMECFAREAGRFLVENEALPPRGLQRFFAGRCGVVTSQPDLLSFYWDSPGALSVPEALDRLGDEISGVVERQLAGGPIDVGVWLHGDAPRVHLIVARGQRVVRLDPVPLLVKPGQRVVVSGEMLQGPGQVSAAVTHGHLGWGICEPEPGVEPPRFRFACELDPDDPTTWVSLQYVPSGHVLTRSAAQMLLHAPGVAASDYRRHPYMEPRPVTRADEVPAAFLEALNRVRAEAGAPPLELEPEQSRVAAEVAPHYFAAVFAPEGEGIAELVALGMMAGWEIPEIVQRGNFFFWWLVESQDLAALLSDALEFPGVRQMLLAEEMDRIAIGSIAGEEGDTPYVALIASTYQLFDEGQHRRQAQRVLDALASARGDRGLRAPRTLDAAQPLAVAAAARVETGEDPEQVLGDMIQDGIDTLRRSVVGWLVETRDLDEISFPESFLEGQDLEIAIAVSTRRPKGEAWGHHVVLMLAALPDERRL